METLQIARLELTVVFDGGVLTEEGASCLLENVKDELYHWFEDDTKHEIIDMRTRVKVGLLCPKN